MSDEKEERRVNVEDLPRQEQELSDEEAKDVKGGLLLPAVQKVREAAARTSSSSTSTTSTNSISGDSNADGSV